MSPTPLFSPSPPPKPPPDPPSDLIDRSPGLGGLTPPFIYHYPPTASSRATLTPPTSLPRRLTPLPLLSLAKLPSATLRRARFHGTYPTLPSLSYKTPP